MQAHNRKINTLWVNHHIDDIPGFTLLPFTYNRTITLEGPFLAMDFYRIHDSCF